MVQFNKSFSFGRPAVEIHHMAKVKVRYELNHTGICLPVAPCS
jgi:hypothetical protein